MLWLNLEKHDAQRWEMITGQCLPRLDLFLLMKVAHPSDVPNSFYFFCGQFDHWESRTEVVFLQGLALDTPGLSKLIEVLASRLTLTD